MPEYKPEEIDVLPDSINYKPLNGPLEQWPLNEETLAKLGIKKWTNAFWAQGKYNVPQAGYDRLSAFSRESCEMGNKLAITPMQNDMGGFKVVAIEDISAGEQMIYGSQCVFSSVKGDQYAFSTFKDPHGVEYFCTSVNFRNFGGFISHAFSDEALQSEVLFASSETKDQVATANFSTIDVPMGYQSLALLEAKRAIKANEELYINYGPQYWRNRSPILFMKDTGVVIDPKLYCLKRCLLEEARKIYNPSKSEGEWKQSVEKDKEPVIWLTLRNKESLNELHSLKQHILNHISNIQVVVSVNQKTNLPVLMIKSSSNLVRFVHAEIPPFNPLAVSAEAMRQIGFHAAVFDLDSCAANDKKEQGELRLK